MKHGIILFLLFLILCFFSSCSGNKVKGPVIRFETNIFNFGEVIEGEEVRYSFTFSNPGTKILTVEDLVFSCWCIELEKADRIVRPGEQGEISVIVKTNGFRGDIAKTITVKTNAPDQEPVLSIEGNILFSINIFPLPLDLGHIDKGQTGLKGKVNIKSLFAKPFNIVSVVTPDPKTEATVTMLKPAKEFQINITIYPPFKTGDIHEEIILKTNLLNELPEIRVPYRYIFKP